MSNLTLLEKLQIKDEKSILIQGLPSSIEKQFAKLSYAKNVTPLLKARKVDFALIFAINSSQLITIMRDMMPALHIESKLWIAYPKQTSKIASDLNREGSWDYFTHNGYEGVSLVELDHMWSAMRFKKNENFVVQAAKVAEIKEKIELKGLIFDKTLVVPPIELERIFTKHKQAKDFFSTLSTNHQKEYVSWIQDAKRHDTKQRRLDTVLEKLMAGKKTPLEK